MKGRRQAGKTVDRHGRTWTATVLPVEESEREDFRFWFEELSPDERVKAVGECLASSLKARGVDELPRLRRVSRIVERPRG
jgi:hypothetical protein